VRQHPFDKFGGCGFAIGTGNGDRQTAGLLITQFQFPDDRHLALAHLVPPRPGAGHPGTDHHEIKLLCRRRRRTQLDRRPARHQRLHPALHGFGVFPVYQGYFGTAIQQELGGRQDAATQAHYQYMFARQLIHE
jgi:hypothetical protein